MEQYITGAGGTIVSNSILNGTARLKWIFREESEYGNGWIAFGDTDTQEYVNDPKNFTIVDFNTLANIEPAVLNIFYMPVGADLEFCSNKSGKYFIDTKTGKEIREKIENPAQAAFKKNLKFLNQNNYSIDFFQGLFLKRKAMMTYIVGEADFPTGEIVLADPLSYLGTKYATHLDRTIPSGSYPIELSILRSKIVGLRIVAARLIISSKKAVKYEIAMPKGYKQEDLGKPKVWTSFGVDTGLACCTDVKVEKAYSDFMQKWIKENPEKNVYSDYFQAYFQESYKSNPSIQNEEGNFLIWQVPPTDLHLIMFSSGMGDGIYSAYWGLDAAGEPVELVIPFMNPAFF